MILPEGKKNDLEPIWVAIPYPVFILNENNVIKTANTAAESFSLQSTKIMKLNSIEKYLGENSVVTEAISQTRKSLASVALYDVEISWLNNEPAIFDVVAAPIGEYDNHIILLFHPQSVSRRLDRTFSHRSTSKSVTSMAAVLAHEIRNPLAGISGAAQLLAADTDPKDDHLIGIIQTEVERINSLVKSFQVFGDISSGTFEAVNLHTILNQAVRSADVGYAAGIMISERYDPSLPLAKGDPQLLLQVIQNLLKNAAEAVPKSLGKILIETSFKQGYRINLQSNSGDGLPLQVSISDNGPGVPEQIKDDIFDPFISSKSTGSGLGLTVVSKIMSDHGGLIEYLRSDSRTTFTLLLPMWINK